MSLTLRMLWTYAVSIKILSCKKMLIQITNTCHMGCSHCMQESSPEPMHMERGTWLQALSVARLSRANVLLISGGEPTSHPQWMQMLEEACKFPCVALITNGSWLHNDTVVEWMRGMLRKYKNLSVQITSVEGIYPMYDMVVSGYKSANLPRTSLETGQLNILALGRASRNEPYRTMAKSSLGTTSCFSSALVAAQIPYLQSIQNMELRGKFCHPLIDWQGKMHWSESWKCPSFADVHDTFVEIQRKACEWRPCLRCQDSDKLRNNNSTQYKVAKLILGI